MKLETLTEKELLEISGGASGTQCLAKVGDGALKGTAAGAVGGSAAFGIGAFGGAILGVNVGAAAGAIRCLA